MKLFMKKLILILFVLCSAFTAGAQIQFGVKAGLNIANLTMSGIQYGASTSSRADFNGGVLASLPLFSSFYLQPELMYSGQGLSYSNSTANGTANYGYLNLPVLFKYQHASGLFAETGPQIGFLLSAKDKGNGNTVDIKSQTQSIDFSWAFGIGYKLQSIPMGIDLRYSLGLTNVYKYSGSGTGKNSVFQFGLFYLFGGK
jgi:hypothetical protein